jgi:hypothetical protein
MSELPAVQTKCEVTVTDVTAGPAGAAGAATGCPAVAAGAGHAAGIATASTAAAVRTSAPRAPSAAVLGKMVLLIELPSVEVYLRLTVIDRIGRDHKAYSKSSSH